MTPDLAITMALPIAAADLFEHITQNAKYARKMIGAVPGERTGKTVAICGAGPSTRDVLVNPPKVDQVWACNSAVPYLMKHNARVTHALGVDQGLGMLDDWATVYPNVTYMIASSVHPQLVAHLRTYNVRIRWFHNFLGIENLPDYEPPDMCGTCYRAAASPLHPSDHAFKAIAQEMNLYRTLYQSSCYPAAGLNVVARAIGVALYQGFDRILVYGADCACLPGGPPMPPMGDPSYVEWTKKIVVYADGRTVFDVYGRDGIIVEACYETAYEYSTGETEVRSRRWHLRADFLVTARHLVWMAKESHGRIQLMGDTLPNALMGWTEKDWEGVPNHDGKGSITGFKLHKDYQDAVDRGDAVLA